MIWALLIKYLLYRLQKGVNSKAAHPTFSHCAIKGAVWTFTFYIYGSSQILHGNISHFLKIVCLCICLCVVSKKSMKEASVISSQKTKLFPLGFLIAQLSPSQSISQARPSRGWDGPKFTCCSSARPLARSSVWVFFLLSSALPKLKDNPSLDLDLDLDLT